MLEKKQKRQHNQEEFSVASKSHTAVSQANYKWTTIRNLE